MFGMPFWGMPFWGMPFGAMVKTRCRMSDDGETFVACSYGLKETEFYFKIKAVNKQGHSIKNPSVDEYFPELKVFLEFNQCDVFGRRIVSNVSSWDFKEYKSGDMSLTELAKNVGISWTVALQLDRSSFESFEWGVMNLTFDLRKVKQALEILDGRFTKGMENESWE